MSNNTTSIEQYEAADKYFIVLTKRFCVSFVATDSMAQAFVIFETLNARGKDLEAADLLKNYFLKLNKGTDTVAEKWSKMVETITQSKSRPTQYIRYYWNGIYPLSREKELFRNIEKEINRHNFKKFLDGLFSMADAYATIMDPEKDNKYYGEDTIHTLICLKEMGVVSFCSFMLPVEKKRMNKTATANDFEEILEIVESLIFRNIIIGNETANMYETKFANLANRISGEQLDITGIKRQLLEWTNDDDDFELNFMSYAPGDNSAISKFILKELYRKTEICIDNGKKIQLEHIMPQSNKEWNLDHEYHSEWVNKLGNLTLIYSTYNAEMQDRSFEQKKQTYLKSEIEENRKLTIHSKWTDEEITMRQQRLFTIANKRWPKRSVGN